MRCRALFVVLQALHSAAVAGRRALLLAYKSRFLPVSATHPPRAFVCEGGAPRLCGQNDRSARHVQQEQQEDENRVLTLKTESAKHDERGGGGSVSCREYDEWCVGLCAHGAHLPRHMYARTREARNHDLPKRQPLLFLGTFVTVFARRVCLWLTTTIRLFGAFDVLAGRRGFSRGENSGRPCATHCCSRSFDGPCV